MKSFPTERLHLIGFPFPGTPRWVILGNQAILTRLSLLEIKSKNRTFRKYLIRLFDPPRLPVSIAPREELVRQYYFEYNPSLVWILNPENSLDLCLWVYLVRDYKNSNSYLALASLNDTKIRSLNYSSFVSSTATRPCCWRPFLFRLCCQNTPAFKLVLTL